MEAGRILPAFFMGKHMKWLWLILLGGAALEDARTGYISDGWPLAVGASGFMAAAARGQGLSALASFLAMLSFLGILSLIQCDGMGDGDRYLLAAVSWWLTLPFTAACLVISFWSALPFALWQSYFRRKPSLRFAPYIALGGGAAFVLQEWSGAAWRLFAL
jgi:prepilin signal peptidase PulO-like enzyme (type II secretory pathway)